MSEFLFHHRLPIRYMVVDEIRSLARAKNELKVSLTDQLMLWQRSDVLLILLIVTCLLLILSFFIEKGCKIFF